MANNVRGPHGMKGAPMAGQKVNGKALKRLAKQLFRDYPVQLTVVLICIALSALIGIAPAVYIETITGYIEEGLTSSWDGVSAKIFSAITTMVILYVCASENYCSLDRIRVGTHECDPTVDACTDCLSFVKK